MYNIKIWDLGEVVEVQKYHHGNYGAPGKKRTPKNDALFIVSII